MQDPVEPREVRVELGLPVVALDLGGQRVPLQPKAFDELLAGRLPVVLGDGGQVRAIGPGRAVELAQVCRPADPGELSPQPPGQDGELLAQRRRGGRLAVGVGEHRGLGVLAGHRGELFDEGGRAGRPDLLDRALDHEGVGEVVDVLGRAGEVDQLAQPGVGRVGSNRREALLEEVLDRLDVVDGHPLDVGQRRDLCGPEVGDDLPQGRLLGGGQRAGAGDDGIRREVDEPLDLDADPLPVEGRLGEVVDEWGDGAAIAAVQGSERDGGLDVTERGHAAILPDACRRPLTTGIPSPRASPRHGRLRRRSAQFGSRPVRE